MEETLLVSFCFFSALCCTSGGLSAVLRRAFFVSWPDGLDDTSIVLFLVGVLLPAALSVALDRAGSSGLLFEHSGVRAKGSDRSM